MSSATSWRVLASAMVATTGAITPPFLAGALGVQIQRDLGGDPATLGLAVGAFFVTAGVASVPVGRWADGVGWARSFRWGAVATTVALLGVAGLARSWLVLGLLLVVGGLGHAFVMPASNLALSREFGFRRRGTLFGLKQSASPAATLLGGVAVPALALTIGWRVAFVLAALVPVLGLVVMPPLSATAPGRRPTDVVPRAHGLAMVRLAVAGGCGAAVVTSSSAFLVVAAVAEGMAEAGAGQLLAVCGAVSLVARVGAGAAADAARPARGATFAAPALLLVVGAVGFLMLPLGGTRLFVVGALVAFAAGTGWPGLFHLAVVEHNEASPASASGVIQSGLATGAASGPILFGLVASVAGYGAAWLSAAGVAVLAATTIAITGRRVARATTSARPTPVDPSSLRG